MVHPFMDSPGRARNSFCSSAGMLQCVPLQTLVVDSSAQNEPVRTHTCEETKKICRTIRAEKTNSKQTAGKEKGKKRATCIFVCPIVKGFVCAFSLHEDVFIDVCRVTTHTCWEAYQSSACESRIWLIYSRTLPKCVRNSLCSLAKILRSAVDLYIDRLLCFPLRKHFSVLR